MASTFKKMDNRNSSRLPAAAVVLSSAAVALSLAALAISSAVLFAPRLSAAPDVGRPSSPAPSSAYRPDSSRSGNSNGGFGIPPSYGSNSNGNNNNNNNTPSDLFQFATDPDYRLAIGDDIFVSVYGEGGLSIGQRIDTQGIIRWPLVGEVSVTGKTVRETEHYLEQVLIDKRMIKKPTVNIVVRSYASKEVTVLGAVNGGGKFRLPQEKDSIEIVDLISLMGGFRATAKSNSVKLVHTDEKGNEKEEIVDVEAMMKGSRKARKSCVVYPGDRIYVGERVW